MPKPSCNNTDFGEKDKSKSLIAKSKHLNYALNMQKQNNAFTLFELLLVLSLLVLLTVVTLPSYHHLLQQHYRHRAEIILLQMVSNLEDFADKYGSYAATLEDIQSANPPSLPYRFQLQSDATTFQLRALPLDNQINDGCGELRIDHLGFKTAQLANCWAE